MVHFKNLGLTCFTVPEESDKSSKQRPHEPAPNAPPSKKEIPTKISKQLNVNRSDGGLQKSRPVSRPRTDPWSDFQPSGRNILVRKLNRDQLDKGSMRNVFGKLKEIYAAGDPEQRRRAENIIGKCISARFKSPESKKSEACLQYFTSVAKQIVERNRKKSATAARRFIPFKLPSPYE